MPLNATESLLFTQLFIDYLKGKFFIQESETSFKEISYSTIEMVMEMPIVYKNQDLVSSGLQYLEGEGTIEQIMRQSTVCWKLTGKAITDRLNEMAKEDRYRRVDLAIKKLTLDSLELDIVPKRYYWQIEVSKLVIPLLLGLFIGRIGCNKYTTTQNTEIKARTMPQLPIGANTLKK